LQAKKKGEREKGYRRKLNNRYRYLYLINIKERILGVR
jgi:hypothetical protein